jgi:hypothetical protein
MEVFEWFVVADVKQMATVAMSDESAVFDFPGVRMFFGFFPAVKRFAVEELDKAFFGIGGVQRLGGGENYRDGNGEKQIRFHAAENKRMR